MDLPGLPDAAYPAAFLTAATLHVVAREDNGQAEAPGHNITSGPGSGKSRLLSELPRLAAAVFSSDSELHSLLSAAFVFHVGFENGTKYLQSFEKDGAIALGNRMMWQLVRLSRLCCDSPLWHYRRRVAFPPGSFCGQYGSMQRPVHCLCGCCYLAKPYQRRVWRLAAGAHVFVTASPLFPRGCRPQLSRSIGFREVA